MNLISEFLCNKLNKQILWLLLFLLCILILSVGISRVYLGVHYTTDVIAGYLLGLSYLIIFIKIVENKNKK